MRDYPDYPNVFRINSASSIFDIEQYQQKLKATACNENWRQTSGNGGGNTGSGHVTNTNNFRILNAAKKYECDDNDIESAGKVQRTNSNDQSANCYSLFGAITNAVTGATCGAAVHPSTDNLKHGRRNGSIGENRNLPRKSLTQSNSNGSYTYSNENQKNSYLLWIITPVAARYVYLQMKHSVIACNI